MVVISLNNIIYDLLNIIRGAKITDNEPISPYQIENWVHQYRSLYIKRDIDNKKYPNPDYIQSIECVKLVKQNKAGNTSLVQSEDILYRTDIKIPKGIDFNRKSGITFIGDLEGNRIQLSPEARVKYQEYKKFTGESPLAYIRDQYVYIHNPKGLEYISIRGIFENPVDAATIINPYTNLPSFDYDSPYPIPLDKVYAIKQDILKNELGIQWNAPSDDVNDDSHINLDSDITK